MKQNRLIALVAIYRLLIALYPRRFREELGAEMTAVFAARLEESARESGRAAAAVFLREVGAWPANCWREHWRERQQRVAVVRAAQANREVASPVRAK